MCEGRHCVGEAKRLIFCCGSCVFVVWCVWRFGLESFEAIGEAVDLLEVSAVLCNCAWPSHARILVVLSVRTKCETMCECLRWSDVCDIVCFIYHDLVGPSGAIPRGCSAAEGHGHHAPHFHPMDGCHPLGWVGRPQFQVVVFMCAIILIHCCVCFVRRVFCASFKHV